MHDGVVADVHFTGEIREAHLALHAAEIDDAHWEAAVVADLNDPPWYSETHHDLRDMRMAATAAWP